MSFCELAPMDYFGVMPKPREQVRAKNRMMEYKREDLSDEWFAFVWARSAVSDQEEA